MERILTYVMSVKFEDEEISSMEQILEDFLKRNNITLKVPVDIFAIATQLGFDVRGAEFGNDLDGLLLVNENEQVIKPFSSNKIIAYNCTKPLEHKKFIVGHELSHYIEEKHKNPDKKIVCAARDHYSKDYSDNRDEQRKDYISAAMLMPQSIMKSKYQNIEPKNTDAFYQQVADEFKVSKVMAIRRIEELFSVE